MCKEIQYLTKKKDGGIEHMDFNTFQLGFQKGFNSEALTE